MFLNECLKEYSEVGKLERAMAEQKSEKEKMRAVLKEQAAEIQRVSAQYASTQPSRHLVINGGTGSVPSLHAPEAIAASFELAETK
jgi:molybdopterin biosynthesis enzyme MoaB